MEYKYRCKSREDSIAVQKALFDMGYRWKSIGPREIREEAMFLYINEDTKFIMRSDEDYFNGVLRFPELIL